MNEINTISSTIGFDSSCRRCGYNLRGLFDNGNCPECNTPIAESLAGNLLQFSDPTWLRRITKGLSVRYWGLLTMILAYFLGMCVFPAFILALIPGAVFNIAGGWIFAAPESGNIDQSRDPKSRRMARISLAILLGCLVIEVLLVPRSPFVIFLLANEVRLVALIGWMVGELSLLYYSKSLAERVPNEGLAATVRTITVAQSITIGLLFAAALMMLVGSMVPGTGGFVMGSISMPMMIGLLLAAATFICFLYTAIRILMLTHRLMKCLERIIRTIESAMSPNT